MSRPVYPEGGVAQVIDALTDRIARLERARTGIEVPFSLAGPLTASTSPPWVARQALTVAHVRVALATPGSTTTTVRVYRNGVSLGFVNLAAGVGSTSLMLDEDIDADDVLSVGVTAAGTGAAGVVAVVWLR